MTNINISLMNKILTVIDLIVNPPEALKFQKYYRLRELSEQFSDRYKRNMFLHSNLDEFPTGYFNTIIGVYDCLHTEVQDREVPNEYLELLSSESPNNLNNIIYVFRTVTSDNNFNKMCFNQALALVMNSFDMRDVILGDLAINRHNAYEKDPFEVGYVPDSSGYEGRRRYSEVDIDVCQSFTSAMENHNVRERSIIPKTEQLKNILVKFGDKHDISSEEIDELFDACYEVTLADQYIKF